ncbi:Interferon-inducible GTPase 5 [Chelonia mydas]|uniref:Interferon-inducible GTPase 5 n=1 Tax=Chelonia mydas TaxID=8469 RepID=M7BVI5_CHEMY|nr:Interferon-inducible GTPase 5 [Chelonia mydas]
MMRWQPRWLIRLVTLWTLSGVAGAQSPVTAQYGENVILNCTFPFIPGVKFQRLIVTWKKERDNGPGEIQVEETISAQQGEDVIMNCSFGPVSNLQLLNITWKKGSDLLVHSYFSQLDQLETQDEAYRGRTQLYPERFHEGNASLRLKNVRLEDKGFYTCHVKPELGRFSMRMRVTVEKDCLLEPKERLLCPDGDSANLSQDGGEELGAASGTGDLSDSVSGSHESLPSTGLNIALLGETGCGKSSFINAIRGLQDEDDNAARTGVIETTKKRKSYQHPKHPNVTIWDMPGIILGKFSLDRDIELSKSDVFLIFSSDNFTTLHANLAQEIQRMGKKVYFVRSKVDVDLYNNRRKRNFNESRILEQIKNTCIECLEREGLRTPRLFLLSHNEYDQHDFHCLAEELGCA